MAAIPRHPYLDIPYVGESLGTAVPMGATGYGSVVRFPTQMPPAAVREAARMAAEHAKLGGGGYPVPIGGRTFQPKPFSTTVEMPPDVNLPGAAASFGASPRTIQAWNEVVSDPASRERFWALMRALFFRPPWSPQ